MKKISIVFSGIFLLAALNLTGQTVTPGELFFIGATPKSTTGISLLQLVKGDSLTTLSGMAGKKDPNFLAVSPDGKKLYVNCSEKFSSADPSGTVEAYSIDDNGGLRLINSESSGGQGPAHVSVDPKGRYVYVANYSAGNFSIFPVRPDGGLEKAASTINFTGSGFNTELQKHPFAHSVSPSGDGKFIYVSTLGLDKINIYCVKKRGKLKPAKTPFVSSTPGAGPRMLAFSPDGTLAFSAEEITASIASYRVNKKTGALTPLDRQLMVPPGYKGPSTSGSDVHLSPDLRFVYATIRGMNQLAVFALDSTTGKLDLIQREDSHGDNPRSFCLDRSGKHLLVANMKSDNVSLFVRDPSSGRVSFVSSSSIVGPECIINR